MFKIKHYSLLIIIILGLSLFSLNAKSSTREVVLNQDISDNIYYELVENAFNLTTQETDMLDENEFIVLNRLGTDDVLDAFAYYWEEDLPIFITTDMILHIWHLIFDKTLSSVEEFVFIPLFREWVTQMTISLENSIESSSDLEAEIASIHSLIYLHVALRLLDPSSNIPSSIEEHVNLILTGIMDNLPINEAIKLFVGAPTNRFIDDFSQYKPRGHYTQSESLESYFRAFKWLSRIPFFFDEYYGSGFLQTSPQDMIRSSLYLAHSMRHSTINLPELGIEANGFAVWRYLKIFLDSLVGQTYAIAPSTLYSITSELLQTQDWQPKDITRDHISLIQTVVLQDTSIPEPSDPFVIDAITQACSLFMISEGKSSCSPKTVVMFGERLGKDTYALNHFVTPLSDPYLFPRNYFPNGLQFASSILDSSHAEYTLTNSFPDLNYPGAFDFVEDEMDNFPGNNEQTIGSLWFNSLEELVKTQPALNMSGIPQVPNFMQSSKWLDQKLTTTLGSWAQFRHDTILYSKTSISGAACSTPEGYVEPYPMFYNALSQTVELFSNSISELTDVGFNESAWIIENEIDWGHQFTYFELLDNFTSILSILESISFHELQGIELTEDQKDFLTSIYSRGYMGFQGGWLADLLAILAHGNLRIGHQFEKTPNTKASLIADIYTEVNTLKTVEVGTGLLEHMIVELPGWNGTKILAVGPVFSYYEFTLPMEHRMTDEEWRGIIYDAAEDSESDINAHRGYWADSYMVSTSATAGHLYDLGYYTDGPEWYDNQYLDLMHTNYPISESDVKEYSIIYTGWTSSSDPTIEIISKESNNNDSNLSISVIMSLGIMTFTSVIRRKKVE